MKKLILFLGIAFLLAGKLNAQTVVSDDYYVYCATSDHFNTPPGSIGVFNYGIDGYGDVFVDLMLFQPSVNDFDDHDINFMETYFNIYDSSDNLIGSEYGYLNTPYPYITTGSYIHKSLALPTGAAKIVFYYWINSEDPGHNPPLWDIIEDREIVVTL